MNLKSKCALAIIAAGVIAQAAQAGVPSTNLSTTAGGSVSGKVFRVDQLIGREVWDSNDKRVGRINDLIVDLDFGRVLYVVIPVGGFVGMGERRIAVPAGTFRSDGTKLRVAVEGRKLTGGPQLTREQEAQLQNPMFVSNAYKYFNQTAWWGQDVQFNNVHKATELIGMDVKDLSDETIGEVNTMAVDLSAGRVVCVVVSLERERNSLRALPPNALMPSVDRRTLNTSIDPGKLAAAPAFDKEHWPNMSDPAWAARLYQYFGKQAYFDSGEMRATGQNTRTNLQPRIYHEPEPKR